MTLVLQAVVVFVAPWHVRRQSLPLANRRIPAYAHGMKTTQAEALTKRTGAPLAVDSRPARRPSLHRRVTE
jgi:hypothetical protein